MAPLFLGGEIVDAVTILGSPPGQPDRKINPTCPCLARLLNKSFHLMSLTEQARWFVLGGDHLVLLDERGQIPQGALTQLPARLQGAPFERFDDWDGLPCYLLDLGADADVQTMTGLRQLMVAGDEAGFRLAGRAWQLATFRRSHRFCGECGAPMAPKAGEWAQECHQGHVAYPRISPCIIVAVRKGSAILLAAHRRHYQAEDPMYTVLAGFVEAGENLEQCVAREVFEESGIRVNNIRYVASQPWPFPHSLMMGFTADYQSGEIRVQDEELVAADPGHHSAATDRAVPRRRGLTEPTQAGKRGPLFAPPHIFALEPVRQCVWAALPPTQSGIISAILCWI